MYFVATIKDTSKYNTRKHSNNDKAQKEGGKLKLY